MGECMKKVLLVNQGFSNNLGDKLIAYSLGLFLNESGFEVQKAGFTCFQETDIGKINFNSYKAERKMDLPIWMKWFLKKKRATQKYISSFGDDYDYLIIGGGQLLKTACYFPYALRKWIDFGKKHARKIILIGVGADSSFSQIEKKIYIKSLKECERIIVRDSFSQKILSEIFGVESSVLPDVAFLYSKSMIGHFRDELYPVVMPFDFDTYKYHFKNTKTFEEYYFEWKKYIDDELEKCDRVMLAYTTSEDKKACYLLKDYLGKQYNSKVLIKETDSLDSLIDCISHATKLYTSRMHAMIIGYMMNKDIECVSVSQKTDQFKKEFLEAKKPAYVYSEILIRELNDIMK